MIESTTAKKKDLNFIIIGILFLFSILLFINLSHLDRSSHKLQLLFFVPFGFYLLGIYFLKSVKTGKRNFISLITLIALIIQLALLLTDISLSDDIYRFILEGWAINQGLNPYHTPIGELSAFLSNPEILSYRVSSSV